MGNFPARSQLSCTAAQNQLQIRFHSSSIFHLVPGQTLPVVQGCSLQGEEVFAASRWILLLIHRSGFTWRTSPPPRQGGLHLLAPKNTEEAPLPAGGTLAVMMTPHPTIPDHHHPHQPPPQSAHPVSCNTIFDCLCPCQHQCHCQHHRRGVWWGKGRTLRGGLSGGSVGCRFLLQ